MSSVAGKVVLITGGASGIGLETGRKLATLGAHVVLVDRSEVPESVLNGLDVSRHGRHLSLRADVTDTESLERAVAAVLAEYGCLDVVVANAGIAEAGTVAISDVGWDCPQFPSSRVPSAMTTERRPMVTLCGPAPTGIDSRCRPAGASHPTTVSLRTEIS